MGRRFATFILLGPVLVWLTIFILLLPKLIGNPIPDGLSFFGVAIGIVAVIGLVPALVLAGIDHLMVQQGLSRAVRTGVCAALGYPAATLGFWWAISSAALYSSFADWVFVAGLFGVIPAAVCSWLAGKWDQGKDE